MMRGQDVSITKHDNGFSLTWQTEKPQVRQRYNKQGDFVADEPYSTWQEHVEVFIDADSLCRRIKILLKDFTS